MEPNVNLEIAASVQTPTQPCSAGTFEILEKKGIWAGKAEFWDVLASSWRPGRGSGPLKCGFKGSGAPIIPGILFFFMEFPVAGAG